MYSLTVQLLPDRSRGKLTSMELLQAWYLNKAEPSKTHDSVQEWKKVMKVAGLLLSTFAENSTRLANCTSKQSSQQEGYLTSHFQAPDQSQCPFSFQQRQTAAALDRSGLLSKPRWSMKLPFDLVHRDQFPEALFLVPNKKELEKLLPEFLML